MTQHQIIRKEPGVYLGWPTIAAAPDGAIHVAYCGSRDAHVCPFGRVYVISSRDGGASWEKPVAVADTPLDDRDAGLCVCPDGTLVAGLWTSHYANYRPIFERFYLRHQVNPTKAEARWMFWQDTISGVTPEVLDRWAPSYVTPDHEDHSKRWLGFWTVRSRDGGKTWDEPSPAPAYCPHGPIAQHNGDLLLVGMKAITRLDGDKNIRVAKSRDQGRSWEVLSHQTSFPPYTGRLADGQCRAAEPHVAVCPSGRLVAMTRYEETRDPENPYRSNLWQFESDDGGYTWTEPHPTPIIGKPPHLTTLRSGELLVTYGYRYAPFGQRACLSKDEGESWDYANELILRDDGLSGDLGYASSAEAHDGSLYSAYYQVDQAGEQPSIWVTHSGPDFRSSLIDRQHRSDQSHAPEEADQFTVGSKI